MRSIIDEILLLASVRQADIEMEPLDTPVLVMNALSRLTMKIKESSTVIVEPEMWPAALGYGPWIEEVWTNYISNAIKYGGSPPRIELGAAMEEGGTVRFWVRDNGAGLSDEVQTRLFQQFERVGQTAIEGHGLGLSIVKRIVEKLGGRVSVQSAPGGGSTFSFHLPAAAEAAAGQPTAVAMAG